MSDKRPDYDKIASIEEVDEEIQKHKDLICRKVKERGQIRDNKREAMKAYNDELKEAEFQLEHNTGILDELARHKKLLIAGKAPSQKQHLQSV